MMWIFNNQSISGRLNIGFVPDFMSQISRSFPVKGTSIYMSSLSLMGIAFDRYRAISTRVPNKQPRYNKVAMMTIFIIDLVSIVLIFPYALNMKVRKYLDLSFEVILDSGRYLMELRHVGRTGEETSESALVSSHCRPSSVFPSCVASTSTSRSSTC